MLRRDGLERPSVSGDTYGRCAHASIPFISLEGVGSEDGGLIAVSGFSTLLALCTIPDVR